MNRPDLKDPEGYVVVYSTTVSVLIRPDGSMHFDIPPPYDARDIEAVMDNTMRDEAEPSHSLFLRVSDKLRTLMRKSPSLNATAAV